MQSCRNEWQVPMTSLYIAPELGLQSIQFNLCSMKRFLFCLSFSKIILFYFFHSFSMCLRRVSWSWSYGSWINNYLCNQCLSPLMLSVWILLWWGVLDTILCDKVCQFATGRWFFRVFRFPLQIKLTTAIQLKYCWKWRSTP